MKNQKEISQEERKAISDGTRTKAAKRREEKREVAELEKKLLTTFEENLDEYMSKKFDVLSKRLGELGSEMSIPEIKRIISLKQGGRYITNQALQSMFEYYQEFMVAINREVVYPPSIKGFCSFIGVSTLTFNNWRVGTDDDRRELCEMIFDYLTDTQMAQAKTRKLDATSTVFDLKASHNMVETSAPIQVEIKQTIDHQTVAERINSIIGKDYIDVEAIEKK